MRSSCCSQSRAGWTRSLALVFTALMALAAYGMEPDVEPKQLLSFWEPVFTLTAGLGYKDNIGLARENPESSLFVRTAIEAIALRLPVDGNQWTFVLTAEDTRFWQGRVVDHEDLVLAQAEYRRFWENDWQAAVAVEGVYLDQVVDFSISETNREALPVRGATLTLRPSVRRELSESIWLALEFPMGRQIYSEALDDYWEFGPKLVLGRTYGHRSEISASFAFQYRPYDDAPARDASGTNFLAGLDRSATDQTVSVVWKHFWDAERHWRSATKAGYRDSRDNASGYFDHERWELSHELRYQAQKWEVSGATRLARYRFPVQTVSETDLERRSRIDLTFTARVERQLTRRLRIHAQYEHERTESNDPLDEYTVNTVSGGLSVEF